MRGHVFGMVLVCGLVAGGGGVGHADPITVTLSIEASAGNWYAYASVSDNCDGLASFIIDVSGTGDVEVTSSLMEAPKGYDAVRAAMFGFATFGHGSEGIGIYGGQPTFYEGGNDPEKDALLLLDVGIAADTYLEVSWSAPVLLASGTYSGSAGTLEVDVGDGQFNVLAASWLGPGHVSEADVVVAGSCVIPEPVTLGLMTLGLCMLAFRHRKRSAA